MRQYRSFGERGIQCSAKRTTSIVAKTHCDILEVSLKEFEDDLRLSIKDKLTSKYNLLFKHYPEASLFQAERQFEFIEDNNKRTGVDRRYPIRQQPYDHHHQRRV